MMHTLVLDVCLNLVFIMLLPNLLTHFYYSVLIIFSSLAFDKKEI